MWFRFSSRETEAALVLAVVAVAMGELALQSFGDESSGVCGFAGFSLAVIFLKTTASGKVRVCTLD